MLEMLPHGRRTPSRSRSEEHTSELQSPCNLVCRLLLEKKKPRTPVRRTTHHARLRRTTHEGRETWTRCSTTCVTPPAPCCVDPISAALPSSRSLQTSAQ